MSSSAINGRYLEYLITKRIQDAYPGITIDDIALQKNKRDFECGNKVKLDNVEGMERCSRIFEKWHRLHYSSYTPVSISRTTDADGKNESSADIIIHYKDVIEHKRTRNAKLPLSIKNNKLYSKSQRPSALDKQCGFDEEMSNSFRNEYNSMIKTIYSANRKHTTFSAISHKENKIYEPINEIVVKYLQMCNAENIRTFFYFIKGKGKEVIILNKAKCVEIYRPRPYSDPQEMKCVLHNKTYIVITFNNAKGDEWIFRLRLHNASSKFTESMSLKYDTVLQNYEKHYKVWTEEK